VLCIRQVGSLQKHPEDGLFSSGPRRGNCLSMISEFGYSDSKRHVVPINVTMYLCTKSSFTRHPTMLIFLEVKSVVLRQ